MFTEVEMYEWVLCQPPAFLPPRLHHSRSLIINHRNLERIKNVGVEHRDSLGSGQRSCLLISRLVSCIDLLGHVLTCYRLKLDVL